MKIGIAANPNKAKALELARHVVEIVGGRAELVLSNETSQVLKGDLPGSDLKSLRADALIAIGGDGTFLNVLQQTNVPLLPVNGGTVGFLAEIDGAVSGALDAAVERLLKGEYVLEERMKLASHTRENPLPDATNEIVVHTSQVAKMRQFEIGIDGKTVGRIRADGIILSTPTGSTSYALSALGPIIDPNVDAIVIAALAPFQATQRAVVVDPLKAVSVRLADPGKDGVVVVDGQSETRIGGGEPISAYRSARRASFVRFGSQFFDRLKGRGILPWKDEN